MDGSTSPVNRSRELEQLRAFNATSAPHPQQRLIHELFEDQVKRTPRALAVTYGCQELTYLELNRRANQLARYLVNQGIVPDQVIGICLQRSVEMVIAVLGTLKAGAAYVPLDPSYPAERLQYMVDDAAPHSLLAQDALLPDLPTTRRDHRARHEARFDCGICRREPPRS